MCGAQKDGVAFTEGKTISILQSFKVSRACQADTHHKQARTKYRSRFAINLRHLPGLREYQDNAAEIVGRPR